MDIFKLFFNHDQRLDKLAKRNANKTKEEVEATLNDFMSPTPTFSKFYLTGTRLEKKQFGINQLEKYDQVLSVLDGVFGEQHIQSASENFTSISAAIKSMGIGEAVVISQDEESVPRIDALKVGSESNVGHLKDELREILMEGHKVLYKEQAHDGFDLHLFSKENIYPQLFYPLQKVVDVSFRFFSINSKRMGSEKHFYFETWTLDRPPHGAEEVFAETVL
jgi:hypothetical protein